MPDTDPPPPGAPGTGPAGPAGPAPGSGDAASAHPVPSGPAPRVPAPRRRGGPSSSAAADPSDQAAAPSGSASSAAPASKAPDPTSAAPSPDMRAPQVPAARKSARTTSKAVEAGKVAGASAGRAAKAPAKAPAKKSAKAPARKAVKAPARKAARTTGKAVKAPTRTTRPDPTLDVERELAAAGARVVAGVDEVGRGAWAGPVVVAAVVPGEGVVPSGLTDSKLLAPRRRAEIEALVRPWAAAYAIGSADPAEIDELGMTAALRLAAGRALGALPVRPDAVVLDGNHDYLGDPWSVRCVVKGDISCVSVAAASVIAKVHRDALMARLGEATPAYAFGDNAGYPSPVHRAALADLGPTEHHRMSWAYWDGLPAWRHLRRPRTALEDEGQMALDL